MKTYLLSNIKCINTNDNTEYLHDNVMKNDDNDDNDIISFIDNDIIEMCKDVINEIIENHNKDNETKLTLSDISLTGQVLIDYGDNNTETYNIKYVYNGDDLLTYMFNN